MANLQQLLKNVSCSTWFAILLGLLALLYWFGIRSYNSVLGNSALPGPRIWPWVGNLPDLFKYGGFHKMLLNYFYKYGRVYKMCLGRSPSIVVTDPEIIKQITVKEFWKFPNRPLFVKPNPPLDAGLFAVRDETWRRIRNTLTPTFTASKLKQIVPIIDTASKKLTAKMQNCAETGESVDVVRQFSLFALDVIMRAAFGMENDIQMNPDPVLVEKARNVFETPLWVRVFSMFPFWGYFSRYVNFLQNIDFFGKILKGILHERRKKEFTGSKDLVQLMLKAHEENENGVSRLSEDEIMAQSITFFLAGFQTTGNTLTCTAYYLATHPEVQDRLIREIDELKETSGDMPLYDMVQKAGYMDQVICEVLRLSGPDFLLARQCEEDSIYKGIKFPKGIGVNIPTYALHRDPDLWDNPLEFNPDNFSPEAKEKRDPFAFLPFGVGPRQCIGMRLAMLEIKIGLLQVMQRFKFERAPETVGKLEHQAVLIMSPKETIYVKIKARKQI
ncbi:cytochrome P450 3A2-like [Acropora millepora]|uniref:cytochrome P450 3A2-like n=1 Tax=Acropora millepora TaxID=45264 RepID=UPI001CF37143|nr:cytochrome P450 3A2-like [Acropora millepora]